jgi:hypothetical protein
MTKKKHTLPATVDTYLTEQANPYALAEMLDSDSELVERAEQIQAQLVEELPPNVRALRAALSQVDDWCLAEAVARQAGFVLGFEFCRRLLTAKGGAR